MSLFNAILPVITLLLGFGSNYAMERHRDRQTERLDQQRRTADRTEREMQDQIAFERRGLLELYDAVGHLLHAVNALIVPTARATKEDVSSWGDDPELVKLHNEAMNANVRCGLAASLVTDANVRSAVERLTTAAVPMYMTMKGGYDDQIRTEYYDASKATTDAIAARVKHLHGLQAKP